MGENVLDRQMAVIAAKGSITVEEARRAFANVQSLLRKTNAQEVAKLMLAEGVPTGLVNKMDVDELHAIYQVTEAEARGRDVGVYEVRSDAELKLGNDYVSLVKSGYSVKDAAITAFAAKTLVNAQEGFVSFFGGEKGLQLEASISLEFAKAGVPGGGKSPFSKHHNLDANLDLASAIHDVVQGQEASKNLNPVDIFDPDIDELIYDFVDLGIKPNEAVVDIRISARMKNGDFRNVSSPVDVKERRPSLAELQGLVVEYQTGEIPLGFSQDYLNEAFDSLGPQCFVADTQIEMPDGAFKNIEDIKIGDEVLAFDERQSKGQGTKQVRRVTDTFINEDKQIIDFMGLKVTPGHAFLSGDGSFKQLIDILREDGTVVLEDGQTVRARTGMPVDSKDDQIIPVGYSDAGELELTQMREGVVYGTRNGEAYTLGGMMHERGYHLRTDGKFINADGDVKTAYWEWCKPDDQLIAGRYAPFDGLVEPTSRIGSNHVR